MDSQVKYLVMRVTPAQAKKWIKGGNIDNRKIRWEAVAAIADAMTRGEWKVTPECITFSKTMRILNGQHRLLAIILCGLTIELTVSFGWPDEIYQDIDVGITRTKDDIFKLGSKVTSAIGTVAWFLFNIKKPTSTQFQVYSEKLSPLFRELLEYCPSNATYYASAVAKIAAIASILNGVDKDYVFSMYRNLVLLKLDDLPPVGRALTVQVQKLRLTTSARKDQLARMMIVFDPKMADKNCISVGESREENTFTMVRKLVRDYCDLDPCPTLGKSKALKEFMTIYDNELAPR